jgi:hypothetical protein
MTKHLANGYKFILGFLMLISVSNKNFAQDTSNVAIKLYVKITLGAGIGSGYPKQNNSFGLAGLGEICVNKQRDFFSIGSRGITEFIILGSNSVTNSLSTAEIGYGRLFQKNKFSFISNLGLSYITFQEQGALIPRNTGFQLFSSTEYEKVNYYSLGIPISLKVFFNSKKKRGWLFELFGNLNSKLPFGGINIANQFIVYKTKKYKSAILKNALL